MNNFVSENIQKKVKKNIIDTHNQLSCKEVKPDNSKFIGKGEGRCVFKKRDKIVKIPFSKEGVAQMQGGRIVFEEIKNDNKSLAMPLDIAEGKFEGTYMVQEKAKPIKDNYKEAKNKFEKKHFNSDTNIICSDWTNIENLGTINDKGVVLTDLGECARKYRVK